MTDKNYGATPAEWAALKKLAKVDLLPVVSNPHAAISSRSRMKQKGKTPSLYLDLPEGRVVGGMTDWTDHETTVRNLDAWSQEPDYGICVQTRRVRGFDIDVPDKALAKRIRLAFLRALGLDELPRRYRPGTGKELLAFVVEGDMSKRSFTVKEWQEHDEEKGKEVTKRWLVEFLATGQQFVAIGQHPDGSRYTWEDGLPAKFPVIDADDFELAWDAVVEAFALPDSERRAARRDPSLVSDLDVADPVAEYLIESEWPTYDVEKGMLYLECPWADGHSSDNGETQTAWLLAGTGRYRNGHFACRHAGCSARTDAEFFTAVGYKPVAASEFDDLTVGDDVLDAYVQQAPGASSKSKELKASARLPLPGFNRDTSGKIETSLENITRALRSLTAAECEIAYDDFRGELMLAETPGAWRSLGDADAVELRMRLEALGFKNLIGKDMMRDALEWVGEQQHFDSARTWLMDVVPAWDGVARIHRFWPDYMRTKDTRYTQALGNYSWTAQAARVLDPGCQIDMVPVLVGEEGLRKSSAIALIAPSVEFFAEFRLDAKDEELSRLMRGCLVGELAELRGISARDGEAVLAWITRRTEKWTPKFKEYATSLARRLVFYGTTNDAEFLQPHMGLRRWLPVVIAMMIRTDWIERDRLQLWAEARDIYLCDGLQYAEVEELAKAERDSFIHIDPWHDKIGVWLDQSVDDDEGVTPRTSGTLRSEQVLVECCGLADEKIKKPDQQRVASVLKKHGMKRIQRKVRGKNQKVWIDAECDE